MDIRIDPITGEPVILATKRAQRPLFGGTKPVHQPLDKHRLQPKKINPFAPGNESITGPEVYAESDNPDRKANDPDWKIRVIPNKFPITDTHEVVILSPDPRRDLDRLSTKQVERIIGVFLERTHTHQKKGQVFIFCNHGPQAGASIAHPHAQLAVFPALPLILEREVASTKKYLDKHGQCLYCELIEKEQRAKHRHIWENEEFVLLCPESSAWPYQLTLFPKTHQPSFASVKSPQVKPLAEAMQMMVKLYNSVLDHPPYNYWIHSVKGHFYHWHIQIVPRTKVLAGIELGAGIMVNDRISPENAAAQFRKALKSPQLT